MDDDQIDFLMMTLKLTKLKVFIKEDGMLVPVIAIQDNFVDKDADSGEPVAWLGGQYTGRCMALSCVDPTDLQIINSGECF
jgi:hypothetical protein